MRVQVVFPVPTETKEVWALFKPFIQRFCDTWRKFPPGVRCTVYAVTQGADASEQLIDMFIGLPVVFERYDKGADLGAQQYIARVSDDAFQVNMTTRCYFHREGWLARLVAARNDFGPALYGVSSSMEGGRFHICTRAFSYDTADFKLYPHDITSRDQGVFFECGEGCLTDWMKSIGRFPYLVTWDTVQLATQWVEVENGFRNGNQEQMLVWDKHSDAYTNANPEEKERLQLLHRGITPSLTIK